MPEYGEMSLMTHVAFPPGTPCWTDVSVPDLDQARTFYAAVAGWEVPPGNPEFGGYTIAAVDGKAVAGLGPMMGEAVTAWTLYFASPDADATQAAIIAAGGTVLMSADDVGPMGRMLIAADPSGAVFGVWQAGQMDGFDAPGTTGSFAWCDLRSTDPDAARAFYAAVFGFSYAPLDMAGPAYSTFSLGGDAPPAGGTGDMMGNDGIPSHWLVYFAVADADATAAAARELGGTVMAEPFDTPFGRMVPMTDPAGAAFWAVQLPPG
jgi:predicted enzyme related to lactoylglutathione lyase